MIDLPFKEEILLHEINKYCKKYEEINSAFSRMPSRYEYCSGSREGFIGGIIAQVWLKISWSEE